MCKQPQIQDRYTDPNQNPDNYKAVGGVFLKTEKESLKLLKEFERLGVPIRKLIAGLVLEKIGWEKNRKVNIKENETNHIWINFTCEQKQAISKFITENYGDMPYTSLIRMVVKRFSKSVIINSSPSLKEEKTKDNISDSLLINNLSITFSDKERKFIAELKEIITCDMMKIGSTREIIKSLKYLMKLAHDANILNSDSEIKNVIIGCYNNLSAFYCTDPHTMSYLFSLTLFLEFKNTINSKYNINEIANYYKIIIRKINSMLVFYSNN